MCGRDVPVYHHELRESVLVVRSHNGGCWDGDSHWSRSNFFLRVERLQSEQCWTV
jgi:hypothetical protein